MRSCAATEQLSHLVAEILAPGSRANVNERDAAKLALTWRGNPSMIGRAAMEQLEAYYHRAHLGEMAKHLTAAGA